MGKRKHCPTFFRCMAIVVVGSGFVVGLTEISDYADRDLCARLTVSDAIGMARERLVEHLEMLRAPVTSGYGKSESDYAVVDTQVHWEWDDWGYGRALYDIHFQSPYNDHVRVAVGSHCGTHTRSDHPF